MYRYWYYKKEIMAITVTSREFRDKQATLLNLVDKGENVIISRKQNHNKSMYMITLVEENDFNLVMTDELKLKIENARQEYKNGQTISCENKEELKTYLESL